MTGDGPHRHVTVDELERARVILGRSEVTEEGTEFLLDVMEKIEECDVCMVRERRYEAVLAAFGESFFRSVALLSAPEPTPVGDSPNVAAPLSIDDIFDRVERIASVLEGELAERSSAALEAFEEWATGSRSIVSGFNLNWVPAPARSGGAGITADVEKRTTQRGYVEFSVAEPTEFSVLFDESYLAGEVPLPVDQAGFVAVVYGWERETLELLPISESNHVLSSRVVVLPPDSYACWIACGDCAAGADAGCGGE